MGKCAWQIGGNPSGIQGGLDDLPESVAALRDVQVSASLSLPSASRARAVRRTGTTSECQ